MAEQKIENKLVNKWRASEGKSLLEMSTGYKTSKDLPALTEINREKIHTALMAAGMTPGLGNVADAADALLYASEGEFGSAGLSAAAMVPIAGQLVSVKKALKAAKKSGEKMVKLYRGTDKWHKGTMVHKGKFLGGHHDELYTAVSKKVAKGYKWDSPTGIMLEFEVPKSYISKHGIIGKIGQPSTGISDMIVFEKGLPKEFLKKVHR